MYLCPFDQILVVFLQSVSNCTQSSHVLVNENTENMNRTFLPTVQAQHNKMAKSIPYANEISFLGPFQFLHADDGESPEVVTSKPTSPEQQPFTTTECKPRK